MNLKRYKHSNIHIGNLQWPRYVSNPTVQQEMNRENVVCVCVYPHIHTMEYYSAIKKKETLPFATAFMNLESITLTEITQRKINAS